MAMNLTTVAQRIYILADSHIVLWVIRKVHLHFHSTASIRLKRSLTSAFLHHLSSDYHVSYTLVFSSVAATSLASSLALIRSSCVLYSVLFFTLCYVMEVGGILRCLGISQYYNCPENLQHCFVPSVWIMQRWNQLVLRPPLLLALPLFKCWE